MSSDAARAVVLVVDADPRIGALFRRAADGLPLEITQAVNAHDAWRMAAAQRPAAVFSDYRLVGLDGVSLLEQIGVHLPDAQRILHTADRISRPLRGVDVPVLAKPCDEGALRELLAAIARSPDARRTG